MRLLTVFTFTAAMLTAGIADACSCLRPPPPKKALAKSAAVFAGKVKSVKKVGVKHVVEIEIMRTWKGTKGKTVTVETATNSAACGYGFKVGTSYLVYCYAPPKGSKVKVLKTNICTRTKTLKSAKADLDALGKGKKP